MTTSYQPRACPACGGTELDPSWRMSSAPPAETAALTDLCASWRGFFREGKLFFTYRRCRRCGQVYAPLYFTPEQLAELYGRMEDNTAGLPEAPLAETQRGYFDLLGGDFPRNGGFLELGPDIGLLTRAAIQSMAFSHHWMVEPNRDVHPALENLLRGKAHTPANRPAQVAQVPDGSLALAVAVHVLDHLVEPQPLLRLLYGKLGPGGALLVVTHNQQSALARIFGARWPAYCLQHPQLYAPSSLEENLRRAGFDPVRVQPTTNHFPVMYLLRHLLFAARLGRVPLPEWPAWTVALRLGNIAAMGRRRLKKADGLSLRLIIKREYTRRRAGFVEESSRGNMITKSKDELVGKLTAAGFVFTQFQLINEGDYAPYDADWNYKDIPHLNILHKLVNGFPTTIEEQVITSVNLQKVLGVPLPMVVVNYQSGRNRQTYYTSFLALLLIVETTWESIGELRTRVVTTYAIGSKRYLKLLHPVVRRLITRNYENLMSEDIPMRARRGQLRRWGYGFRTDGPPHTFTSTLHILDENMVVKKELHPPPPVHLDQARLAAAGSEDILTTQSDHWGLRLSRRGEELVIFPRLCPHEGACLDRQTIDENSVRCPWHGRVLRPLASLPFPWPAELAPIELRHHRLTPGPEGLLIEFKDTPLAAQVDLHEQAMEVEL